MALQQPRPRQPNVRTRNVPISQKKSPGNSTATKSNGNSRVRADVKPTPTPRRGPRASVERAPVHTDSEDEAYGGSAGSEEDELKGIVEHESDHKYNTTDESEDQETPRRIPFPLNEGSRGPRGKIQPAQTASKDPAANWKNAQRRVVKATVKAAAQTGEEYNVAQTFGDDERKCVKEFREAYNAHTMNGELNEMPLENEVQHLTALAGVYKRSAIGTLNIHNMLRASGLYNICLKKCQNQRPHLYAEIMESLIQLEEAVMRRILKLKSTNCHLFAHKKKQAAHLKELQEIRDICSADFKNIIDSLREFPSAQTLLKQKSPSKRHIAAEENIMATTSLMFGEVTERVRGFFAGLINECMELQGPPPCKYVLVSNHKLASKDLSPFEPISIFIVIEKDTAGIKAYFKTTLALLGMKINNLGETSLLSLNIRSIAWFTMRDTPSGLAMANFIDDTEKREFSTIPLECIKTPTELLRLAVSDKQQVRQGIITLLHNMTFITGDMKMYKELGPVRTAVLQREQTEKSYKKSLFTRYQNLVRYTDPLSKFALQEGNEDEIQSNVMSLASQFITCYSEMEKHFTSEGTINKLEEMMHIGASVSYSNVTITTESREKQGIFSTISTRLETPESASPSPEPVKLPDIPVVFRKKDTWTFDKKVEERSYSPPPDHDAALRKLKERKANLRTEYRKSVYFHVPRGAEVRRSTTQGGATSDISTSSTTSSGFSNTWRKQQKKKRAPRPKTPLDLPTPEPIERFVYIVPAYDGKAKNVMTADSSRFLVLLHSLTSAITLSNRSATCLMSTKHKTAFTIGSKDYEGAYIKILQVVVPFISVLTQLVFGADVTTGNLKKGLQSMDLNADDDEFVVALTHFQNRKYTQCCKAIYKYLENRSDITFVGEPFASDFTEVCQELLEDGVLTPERYGAVHLLMAHCQERRAADDEALSYWSELLSKAETAKEKANVYEHIAECCVKLGRERDALKSVNRAIALYREAQTTAKTINFDGDLERLQKLKLELSS